jgi:hypothetical protein
MHLEVFGTCAEIVQVDDIFRAGGVVSIIDDVGMNSLDLLFQLIKVRVEAQPPSADIPPPTPLATWNPTTSGERLTAPVQVIASGCQTSVLLTAQYGG